MKKKGFTLVELLAVIAILAILVIIALPNVLELYKNARKNAFLDEVQSVYTSAINKYMLKQYGGTSAALTFKDTDTGDNKIDLQGGSGTFQYCIVVETDGKVSKFRVSNGTFYYKYSGETANPTKSITQAKDIVIGDVAESTNVASCS